ncbi:hypothetical protein ACO1O0_002967 [Amphichorda felina]
MVLKSTLVGALSAFLLAPGLAQAAAHPRKHQHMALKVTETNAGQGEIAKFLKDNGGDGGDGDNGDDDNSDDDNDDDSPSLGSYDSIDITQGFKFFSYNGTVHEPYGPYTFAVDAENQRLFFTVPEAPEAPKGFSCLTALNMDGDRVQEYMYLYGFGALNVSFAAEPVGNSTRFWFEVDPDEHGRAQGIAAIMWGSEQQAHYPADVQVKAAPIKGATEYLPTFDPATKSLVLRYRLNGKLRVAAYEAARAAEKDFSKPLYDVEIPSDLGISEDILGYAALGQNVYLMAGKTAEDFSKTSTKIVNFNVDTAKASQGPYAPCVSGRTPYGKVVAQGLGMYYVEGEEHSLIMGVAGISATHREAHLFRNEELAH